MNQIMRVFFSDKLLLASNAGMRSNKLVDTKLSIKCDGGQMRNFFINR